MHDHIHSLGYLALASRLKRLSDEIYGEGSAFYQRNGIAFEPSCFPLLTLIEQQQEISISDAVMALGLSQPAISQKVAQLQKQKLITLMASKDDKRSKRIRLSAKGHALIEQLRPLWYAIRQTLTEVGEALPQPLLPLLQSLEQELNAMSLEQRMQQHLKAYYRERVEILDYKPHYAKEFERLNMQWLNEFFTVEPYDVKVLGNPQKYIIDQGGEIYFAALDGKVVGTCALFKEGDEYEFTKMGVEPSLRGAGIGRMMLTYALERATVLKAKRVYILTSSSLNPAVHLYRGVGFRDIPLSTEDKKKYQRADVKLEWFPAAKKHTQAAP